MPMSRPVVRVSDLTVRYGSVLAVDSISLNVDEGQILGVIGPNGAGKTALFRAILGLNPYRGHVELFGQRPEAHKHIRPFIGYVPQKMGFEFNMPMTVSDVVSVGLVNTKAAGRGAALIERGKVHRVSMAGERAGKSERVAKALEAVDLGHLTDRRIGSLSGGELQRAFIAMALVKDPLLMILDEPATSMDVRSRESFYSIIRKANRKHGITVVLSLHDLDPLREHTDSVVCMNRKLCFHGDTDKFFADASCVKMYTEAVLHDAHHQQQPYHVRM